MSYCEKCGSLAEHNTSKASDYYMRCTSKTCLGRSGVAVVREKPEEENKGGK